MALVAMLLPTIGLPTIVVAQLRVAAPTIEEFAEAKQRLAALGYWVEPLAGPTSASFRHALTAFQKVEGRERTGRLTAIELEALRHAETPRPIEVGETHLEVNLHRQTLFFVDSDGSVVFTLPVSTGSGKCFTEGGKTRRAITPVGRFRISWRIAGKRKSPLGELFYPLYFFDGIAIHGNPAIPVIPASHGCIRVPIFAAIDLFRLVPNGMPLLIHEGNPDGRPNPPPAACPPGEGTDGTGGHE